MGSSQRLLSLGMALLGGIFFLNAYAAESPYPRLESRDPRFDALIAPDTKIQKIADDLKWSEGPLWVAKTRTLLFSDIPRNVIMQWNEDKGVTTGRPQRPRSLREPPDCPGDGRLDPG